MTQINQLSILFILVPVLGAILLLLNLLLAKSNPDNQKIQSFECGGWSHEVQIFTKCI